MRAGRPRRGRLAGTALVLLLAIGVQIPFFDRGLSLLDEGTVLANADALAHGEVLYRDRITVIAPLGYELLAAGFARFGSHVAVGRALQAALFVGCVLLALAVLRRVASEGWALAGALSLLALKPLGFLSWTIVNYSPLGLFALLLALASLARWLEGRRWAHLALAGLASGLVFVSKQNLAAVAAVAVAGAVLADWWASPPRRLRSLFACAALLLVASLLPVGAAALRYAELGALRPAFGQVIASMPSFADAWALPFPSPALWRRSDPDWGLRLFAFFPQPLVELALAGRLDLDRVALFRPLEWAVKLCYALPLLAVALVAARWVAAGSRRSEQSVSLACALFAAGAFASMSYRPDWAHLMNVWPLLHIAIVAALAAGRGRIRVALAGLSALAWLGLAAAVCWAFLALDWETLRTPRGALRIPAAAAPSVRALLAWEAERPDAERIAFLPALPTLHFLSGRPLPLATDALIPGIFDASDEERMLGQLAAVEAVVWDEGGLPWVRDDVVDVAPRLSHALATQFRLAQRVAPRFLAFERANGAGQAPSHDLWSSAEAQTRARLEHWLFYRVWAFTFEHAAERRCVETSWRAARGDRVVATPLAHPSLWQRGPPAASRWIRFELTVSEREHTPGRTRAARLSAAAAPEPWQVPLELADGAEAVLRFCAQAEPGPPGAAPIRAGWAEPRIERGAAAPSPPAAAPRP